jgi:hypothetical protein
VATTKTGSNDARRVVWALFFFFFYILNIVLLHTWLVNYEIRDEGRDGMRDVDNGPHMYVFFIFFLVYFYTK